MAGGFCPLPIHMVETIRELSGWHTPATDYLEAVSGNFRLYRILCPPGIHSHMRINGSRCTKITSPFPMTLLQENRGGKWRDWMADDPFDYWAMQKFAATAKGKVLVGGLGLGLVAHELALNDKVTDVTVVERSHDVCTLVKGNITGGKVTIVESDFWDFIESDTTQWDVIIADIWVANNKMERQMLLKNEVVPAREKLHAKYPNAVLMFHGFEEVSDVSLAASS